MGVWCGNTTIKDKNLVKLLTTILALSIFLDSKELRAFFLSICGFFENMPRALKKSTPFSLYSTVFRHKSY